METQYTNQTHKKSHPSDGPLSGEKKGIDSEKLITEQEVPALQKDESEISSWEDFQDIAHGDFKRLLGCG